MNFCLGVGKGILSPQEKGERKGVFSPPNRIIYRLLKDLEFFSVELIENSGVQV